MKRPHNPYTAGQPVRGADFIGRTALLEQITSILENPRQNTLILYGPRRIGKTSLLRRLEQTLDAEQFLPIYFDLQDQTRKPLPEALRAMAQAACEAADISLPGLKGLDDTYFRKSFLPKLLKELAPRRPVFLVDEFDVLDPTSTPGNPSEAAEETLFPFLRKLLEREEQVTFVFVMGRRAEHLSSKMLSFIKSSQGLPVWVMGREEADQLARQGETAGGLAFTPEALNVIFSRCCGHPLLTQLVCSKVWEQAVKKDRVLPVSVSDALVLSALPAALEAGDAPMQWWFEGIPHLDRVAAALLAPVLTEPMTEAAISDQLLRLSRRVLERDREGLTEELVKGWVLSGVGDQLRFGVELQRAWVAQKVPVRRALLLLDERHAGAHRAYTKGADLLHMGMLGPALEHFRQALEDHPLHLQAHLGMADAYLENQQPREAVECLEKAWRLEPDDAGPRLRKALLALGEALLAQSNLPEARQVLERMIARFPDCDEARNLEGQLRRAQASSSTVPAAARPLMAADATQPGDASLTSGTASTGTASIGSPALQQLITRVDELFCGESHEFGSFKRLNEGLTVIPDLYYRFDLEDTLNHRRVSLQVFGQLKGLGGQLWEQQARALEQLQAANHPALPKIQDGSYLEEDELAFVITEGAEYTLAEPGGIALLRSMPLQALRALRELVEALNILHGSGMLHRHLTPDAIDVEVLPESGSPPGHSSEAQEQPLQLRLARFEMSVLVSNLLKRISLKERPPTHDKVQGYYRSVPPERLVFLPPERLQQVLGEPEGSDVSGAHTAGRGTTLEQPGSDIFSLGMLAYSWFVGDPPLQQVQQALAGGRFHLEAWESLLRELRSCTQRARLPGVLEKLLLDMLSQDVRSRPRAQELQKTLLEHWSDLRESLGARQQVRELLIATIPEELSRELKRRGHLQAAETEGTNTNPVPIHDVQTQQGLDELLTFMQADLRGATLTYAERGFAPYTQRTDPQAREARYVVLGLQFAYFCTIFEDRRPFGPQGDIPLPQVLFSRFTLERHRYTGESHRHAVIPLPPLRPVPSRDPKLTVKGVQDLAQWTPFLEAVKPSVEKSTWQLQVEDALSWLLAVHQVELDARMYAYELASSEWKGQQERNRTQPAQGQKVKVTLDQKRDDQRKHNHPLLNLYSTSRTRPDMGDYFEQLHADEGTGELSCYPDQAGRPLLRESTRVRFSRRLDARSLELELEPGNQTMPERGWLAPRQDALGRPQLQRQERALVALSEDGTLLGQLKEPRAIVRPYTGSEDSLKGLKGSAPKIIRDILSSTPLYALHGPPGTGKTTVAARALEALLSDDRSARVLVSAQSNFALDNLAERLLERLKGQDVGAVRIFSEHAGDRVSEQMKRYSPEAQVEERTQRIQTHCQDLLDRRALSPELLTLVAEWKEQSTRSRSELRDRLARGANLVFATCNIAAPERVELASDLDAFDLVIVEEAAKAWPTELMVPLVRGRRWLLIGDHRQLPAFRRQEVLNLLVRCQQTEDPELQRIGAQSAQILPVFDLFKQLFDRPLERSSARALYRDPRARLENQFRMAPDIGELVSNAFYEGTLKSDPSTDRPHSLVSPSWLKGHSLIWLDTQELSDNAEAPVWRNTGEVRVIVELLSQLSPMPGKKDEEALAILAPYRDQVDALKNTISGSQDGAHLVDIADQSLSGPSGPSPQRIAHLAERVSTVDAFQGREAEVVIVSLTRFNRIDASKGLKRRLGHLAAPERLNVMLSRARRLLILVGSFQFFKESGQFLMEQEKLPHWQKICQAVEENGIILKASDVLGPRKQKPSAQGRRS